MGRRTVLAPVTVKSWPTTWFDTVAADEYESVALSPDTYSTPSTKLSRASAQLTPLNCDVAAWAGAALRATALTAPSATTANMLHSLRRVPIEIPFCMVV